MQLAILGATGQVGREVTKQALATGHEVVALVRKTGQLEQQEKLRVVIGDATTGADIDRTVKDVDAVISVLGHSANTPRNLQTQAMRAAVRAMAAANVTRIISLTGAGVLVPDDEPRFIDKLAAAGLMLVDPYRFHDGIQHLEVLRLSGLEWTLVRTPKHTGGVPSSNLYVGKVAKGLGFKVSRADIAAFILSCIEQRSYLRQCPAISS